VFVQSHPDAVVELLQFQSSNAHMNANTLQSPGQWRLCPHEVKTGLTEMEQEEEEEDNLDTQVSANKRIRLTDDPSAKILFACEICGMIPIYMCQICL
jgi:hypothetical protein